MKCNPSKTSNEARSVLGPPGKRGVQGSNERRAVGQAPVCLCVSVFACEGLRQTGPENGQGRKKKDGGAVGPLIVGVVSVFFFLHARAQVGEPPPWNPDARRDRFLAGQPTGVGEIGRAAGPMPSPLPAADALVPAQLLPNGGWGHGQTRDGVVGAAFFATRFVDGRRDTRRAHLPAVTLRSARVF